MRKICSTPCPGARAVNTIHGGCAADRCGCPGAAETTASASPTTATSTVSTRPVEVFMPSRIATDCNSGMQVSPIRAAESRIRGPWVPVGLVMIGCDETTARARHARKCPGGVRSGGRRGDRRARRRARERGACADDRAVGADLRHETQAPGHRRRDPRGHRSDGAPERPHHDAGRHARHAPLPDHDLEHLEPRCHQLVPVVPADRGAHRQADRQLRRATAPSRASRASVATSSRRSFCIRTFSARRSISSPRAAPARGTAAP